MLNMVPTLVQSRTTSHGRLRTNGFALLPVRSDFLSLTIGCHSRGLLIEVLCRAWTKAAMLSIRMIIDSGALLGGIHEARFLCRVFNGIAFTSHGSGNRNSSNALL